MACDMWSSQKSGAHREGSAGPVVGAPADLALANGRARPRTGPCAVAHFFSDLELSVRDGDTTPLQRAELVEPGRVITGAYRTQVWRASGSPRCGPKRSGSQETPAGVILHHTTAHRRMGSMTSMRNGPTYPCRALLGRPPRAEKAVLACVRLHHAEGASRILGADRTAMPIPK